MAVVASATGAAVFGLSGVAAGLAGGALLGAGAGALYSGITGDGNILNSALTGGLIGGAVGGLGAAFAPASTVGGLTGASGAAGAMGAGSSLGLGGAGATAAAGNTAALIPAASSGGFGLTAASVPSLTGGAGAGLTGAGTGLTTGQILGYGLAGSAAMSLLGSANTPKINSNTGVNNPSYIRPYTYSANPTNNYPTNNNGLGSSAERNYFNQTMTAQPIYKAAEGGLTPSPNLDFMGNGAYPMSQQVSPTYAVPSQMPTSAQQVRASYEPSTNPLTGEPISMAQGGSTSGLGYKPITDLAYEINNSSPAKFGMGRALLNLGNVQSESAALAPAPAQAQPSMSMSSNDAVKAYNDAIMQKAINTYVNNPTQGYTLSNNQLPRQPLAPQSYAAPQAPSNFDQTLLDQYRSANPNMRSYNAATQRYGVGIPNQSQYDAFKAQKDQEVADLLVQSQIQPYSYDGGGGGAAGGLPRDFAYAAGGHLGGYSDGGRMLKGPGDGVSDSIPATIGNRQPARLADGEFVIPARIVSELGNGSTDAGARRLYEMMDKVQAKRKKSVGKGKFAVDSKAHKDLPA